MVVKTDQGDLRVVESLVDEALVFLEAEMTNAGVP